jgi:hypothetical protein
MEDTLIAHDNKEEIMMGISKTDFSVNPGNISDAFSQEETTINETVEAIEEEVTESKVDNSLNEEVEIEETIDEVVDELDLETDFEL